MLGALDVPFAYAFTLGMVATVNPCGFPMLPAYLSFFIGADDTASDRVGSRIPRALRAATAVSSASSPCSPSSGCRCTPGSPRSTA
jgi:cytochrome c biogenesis protein CcdA